MDLVVGLGALLLDGQVVAIVEGEGGFVAGLGLFDHGQVVGDVGLDVGDAVAVEVEF